LAEFILPYENVRLASDPDQLILEFYRSTYEIGASLAGWDRSALERSDSRQPFVDWPGTTSNLRTQAWLTPQAARRR